MSNTELKRLAFVPSATAAAANTTYSLYARLLDASPEFAKARLQQMEGLASATLAPYAERAGDLGGRILSTADAQLDLLLAMAEQRRAGVEGRLKAVREAQELRLKELRAALDRYYGFMTSKTEDVVAQLRVREIQDATMMRVQASRDALLSTVKQAREAADPDAAVRMAWDAWTSFASLPVVAKVLSTAEPATKAGMTKFHELHDVLVMQPLYKRVVDGTASTLSFATRTTPYRLGATYLYPWVQPVADPAFDRVSNSIFVGQVMEYWRPASTPAPEPVSAPVSAPVVTAH
uniref:Uncharacterized protein n=1 Tax=Chlamydomonas euryale TaxID=1486919 RepID=A0A6U2HWX8_9CHLO|mmetsp:Transcript_39924/g.118878  ORF Transcript_39924/g.118878 Transcript_39924/m.118878 type:complete len:292 (+) Transcript_39924:161-1036(+)